MASEQFGFIHNFAPAPSDSPRTLLLLHGTGGDENDLMALGAMLDPEAARLSPRGKVLENGMPRFFRRLSEGVFDEEDIRFRAEELAAFITSAASEYTLDTGGIVAVGFSNGANIAAALLLLHPKILQSAILMRPMVPLVPDVMPDLEGVSILIAAGRHDPIVAPQETERLANILRDAGAITEVAWQEGGHTLTPSETDHAKKWLEKLPKHRLVR